MPRLFQSTDILDNHPFGTDEPYSWPNPAFPFRVYYESPDLRIFIIENISHNWKWIFEWGDGIRETDVFFVICGSHQSNRLLLNSVKTIEHSGLSKSQFIILANSALDQKRYEELGFETALVNNNAWLDESLVMKILPGTRKKYDGIYVGRLVPVKRHHLATKVPNLALVAGMSHSQTTTSLPKGLAYINEQPLSPQEVCQKINESVCGLILSEAEGSCYASSEYLMCGIPVVSTISEGGRDVWYTDRNAIVVEPNEDAVRDAVLEWKARDVDPAEIRDAHIALSQIFRENFVEKLREVFQRYGVRKDAQKYFERNFYHKMKTSVRPPFPVLFGTTESRNSQGNRAKQMRSETTKIEDDLLLKIEEARSTAATFKGSLSDISVSIMQSILSFQDRSSITGDMIEYGVLHGKSASVLLSNIGRSETLHLVDVNEAYPDFDKLRGISPNFDFHKGASEQMIRDGSLEKFLSKGVRLSHHDASHSFNNVITEMDFMHDRIAPGGVMVLDDFLNPNFMQVVAACFTHIARTKSKVEPFLFASSKMYLCRKEDFRMYERLVVEEIFPTIKKVGFPLFLTRTEDTEDYRAFTFWAKPNRDFPDYYGVATYGDRYYKIRD